jgi:hypothetical protein
MPWRRRSRQRALGDERPRGHVAALRHGHGGAAGQRGRAETFIELDVPLLPSDRLGYLALLFGADALGRAAASTPSTRRRGTSPPAWPTGSASASTATSCRASPSRSRASEVRRGTPHRRRASRPLPDDPDDPLPAPVPLVRRGLAPASPPRERRVHGPFAQAQARRLADAISAGQDLGLRRPHRSPRRTAPDKQRRPLAAVQGPLPRSRQGPHRWGVPAYNGGLFSADPAVNPVGDLIDGLDFTNAAFGPALTALVLDRTPDGAVGPIDFRSLSVREFGTIYEGLLESELSSPSRTWRSTATALPARRVRTTTSRSQGRRRLPPQRERAAQGTGSYFTKPFAVDHLLDRALEPTLDEHLEARHGSCSSRARGRRRRSAVRLPRRRHLDGIGPLPDGRRRPHRSARSAASSPSTPCGRRRPNSTCCTQPGRKAMGDRRSRRSRAPRCSAASSLAAASTASTSTPSASSSPASACGSTPSCRGLPLSFLDHNLISGDSLTGIGTLEEALAVLEQGSRPKGSFQAGMFDDPLRDALEHAKGAARAAREDSSTPPPRTSKSHAQPTNEEVRAAIEPVTAFFDLTVAVRLGPREAR